MRRAGGLALILLLLGAAFAVGLFSTLDALLNAPLARIVPRLPLSDVIREALVEGHGPMGEALRCALAYERGDWSAVNCFGLPRATIQNAFLSAVDWVEKVDQEIAAIGR